MNPPSVRDRILELAARELRMESSHHLLTGDLAQHLDSVQRLTLVVAIEDTFEVCLDPEDEAQVATLDDVVQLVQGKLGARDA